jgi:hypothetical protein
MPLSVDGELEDAEITLIEMHRNFISLSCFPYFKEIMVKSLTEILIQILHTISEPNFTSMA